MGSGSLGKVLVGAFLTLTGAYPICTANHMQNLLSGLVLFLIGVAVMAWGAHQRQ